MKKKVSYATGIQKAVVAKKQKENAKEMAEAQMEAQAMKMQFGRKKC